MKKLIAILLCLVLAVSLAACGGGEKESEASSANYEEARKAGYEEGYKSGYDAGLKDGKDSVKPSEKVAKFSGAFTAIVEKLIPDYYALPGNTVAVVHLFQDGPFLLRFEEDMTGKLTEGKAYVFEFKPFEVVITADEQYPDIKNYMYSIEVTAFRLAEDSEMGLAGKTPTVEIVTR